MLVWILDPLLEAVSPAARSFSEAFMAPDTREVYERSLVSVMIVLWGFWMSVLLARRKTVADALQRNQWLLAESQRIAQIGSWQWSRTENRLLQCTEEYARLLGMSVEEVFASAATPEAHVALVHPDDRERYRRTVYPRGGLRAPMDIEYRVLTPGGTERHVREHIRPVFDEASALVRTVGTLQDVTDRVQAQAALRESEARYRALIEATNVIPWELDVATWRFTYVGPQAERLFGYPVAAWLEDGFWMAHLYPDDREAAEAYCRAATERGEDHEFEYRFLASSGEALWVRDIVTVESGEHGPVRLRGVLIDIDKQKRAGLALAAREARYRGLFEHVPIGVWEEDYSGVKRIVERLRSEGVTDLRAYLRAHPETLSEAVMAIESLAVNPAGMAIYRAPSAEAFWERASTAPEAMLSLAEFYVEEIAALAAGEGHVVLESVSIAFDGAKIPVRTTTHVPEAFADTWSWVVTTEEDISEQRRAERVESSENELLRAIASDAPLAHILEESCRRMEEQFPGTLCSVLLLDADGVHLRHGAAPSLPDAYNRAIDGVAIGPSVGSCGTAAFLGKQVIVSDIASDPLWKDYRELAAAHGLGACWSTPVFSSRGKVLGTFALYYRACREPADDELRVIDRMARLVGVAIDKQVARQALERSEERFRDFAESASDWFWELDAQFRFTFHTGRRTAGEWRRTDVLGKTPWEIPGIDARDELWQSYRNDLEAHRPVRDFEFGYLTPAGERRFTRVNGNPVFASDGRFTGYRGTARDVTGQRRLQTELRRAQKMKAVGQLAGGVAHDFNNLLGIVIGYLDLLEGFTAGDEKASRWAGSALRAALRGADLTRRLLAFSREESQEKRPADINALVAGMHDLMARSLTAAVKVEATLAEGLWWTEVDPGEFEDTVLNLVINARDAMPGGGVLSVETENLSVSDADAAAHPGLKPGAYVRLRISDSGEGMSAQVLEHAIEPFFTTKERGRGTGLGLSLAYGFVQRCGGTITLYSEPGTGTTVTLYLPGLAEAPGAQERVQAEEPAELPCGSETVLVVEDEAQLLELTQTTLRDLGYRVLTAPDARGAMEVLASGEVIDLLFSDVVMPGGMDGHELAREARAGRPRLKVLLTSGHAQKAACADRPGALRAEVLDKPYRKTDLARRVRQVIDAAG